MTCYKDLREYILELERQEKLFRCEADIIRETQAASLYWLQFRGLPETQWKSFFYEHVKDINGNKLYRLIMGPYATSREIAALGLRCEPEEINEKWCNASSKPIPPRMVDTGPVQEVIIKGEALDNMGLGFLPAPVENPGYSGAIRTTTQFITKDPETGIRNVGDYSGFITGPKSMRFGIAPSHHAAIHFEKARAMGKKLQVAVVMGVTPNIAFVSASPISYSQDELEIAGALAGEAVELVKCQTVDLEVPATAEIVIEGEISNEWVEPGASFGDYPGYMYEVENALGKVIDVTCITHRREPIFTATVVGFPPNDTSVLSGIAREAGLYKYLKRDCYIPGVLDVALPHAGGGSNYVVVKLKKTNPWEPWQILNALAGYDPALGKIAIVVDEDIDPRDEHAVNWALSFSMQPHRDMRIITHRTPKLDPSAYPPGSSGKERSFPSPSGSSAVLIDATRKWPYAPVGLPQKAYMEEALKLWQEAGLPRLNLKKPWHGYALGRWTAEDEYKAKLTLQGEHFKLGEELQKKRKKMP